MADVQFGGNSYPHHDYFSEEDQGLDPVTSGAGLTALVNWGGAIVSVALVIAMGVWSWQLLMRDVTDVPVVRALEGPMRIAPEDPGGAVAANQGLAVNRLAEGAEAAPVPDQLVLAPPPVELPPVSAATPDERAFENGSIAETAAAPAEAEAEDTSALIERLLAEAQPLETAPESAPVAAPVFEIIPASVPGVRVSPRPTLRPASLITTSGSGPSSGPLEIAAADLEAGTRLVQLGAFDTADMARAEWARLVSDFPDFFTARARVIEQATRGGQAFYRLRAHGFADLAASRRFCAALVARGAACVPATVR